MNYKIFIIDDEKAICDGLLEILNDEGYKAFAHTSGRKALEPFNKEKPDLCIVDLKMPEMNGLELIKKIKKIKPDVKILLLTGSLTEISDSQISKLRIAKVLQKPLSRKDMLASVRDVLGEADQIPPSPFVKGRISSSHPYKKGTSISSPLYKRGVRGDLKSKLTDSEKNSTFSNLDKESYWSKGKILIVDDKEEFRLNLKEALISNNYYVNTAENGIEALEIIQDEIFDIILMDIHMPQMDGIEAVKKIKSLTPKAFVLMMTGEADDDEINSSIEEGGYACIRKPFTIKKLIKSLEWYAAAGSDIKRQYDLYEKYENLPVIKKIFINLYRYIKARIFSNRMNIITIFLSLASIVLGFLIFFLIQSTGDSISNSAKQSISKYESYIERIIGYLERDERRELGR